MLARISSIRFFVRFLISSRIRNIGTPKEPPRKASHQHHTPRNVLIVSHTMAATNTGTPCLCSGSHEAAYCICVLSVPQPRGARSYDTVPTLPSSTAGPGCCPAAPQGPASEKVPDVVPQPTEAGWPFRGATRNIGTPLFFSNFSDFLGDFDPGELDTRSLVQT